MAHHSEYQCDPGYAFQKLFYQVVDVWLGRKSSRILDFIS